MPNGTARRRTIATACVVGAWAILLVPVLVGRPRVASAAGISDMTEYATPGTFPWGTAFDGAGRVWVALPGCDPAPMCSPSTPPGELGRLNPDTGSWSAIVALPAGYGQPLFVAVDHSGIVWFTMPVTNAIGRYDPATATVRQWAVPTVSAGPWGLAV